jgi:predicted Rossmann-fold nucleotide-binding protein
MEDLITWFKKTLVTEGVISPEDLNLFSIADSADEVIDTIFNYYEKSGFEPSQEEEEIALNL